MKRILSGKEALLKWLRKYRVLGSETQVVSDKQLDCSAERMGRIVPSGGEILNGYVGPH